MIMLSNFILRVVGDKRQWREYKARARQLPPSYRAAIDALERYVTYFGTGGDGTAMYADLIDLFEQSAANGTSIRDIVGEDPVEFVETFVRNYPKGQWIIRERERLTSAIDRVAGAAALTAGDASSARAVPSSESDAFASIDEWIARESIPFSSDEDFAAAVDQMMAALGDEVSVLGVGEALHGGEEHVTLRNRLFQRLVEAHGYSAITLEITHSRARLVNDYIAGRGPAAYEDIQDSGFSYGAGLYAANRELVEWLKQYNADPAHPAKLSFYGTVPSEQGETTESPRRPLESVLTYWRTVDTAIADKYTAIIEPLLGADADWEGPATAITRQIMARLMGGAADQPLDTRLDAAEPFGTSPRAQALRLAVEQLDFEMRMRRPELVAQSDRASFDEALHDLSVARHLLALHAALARGESVGTLVSMRDAMAADHLVYIAAREGSGKVLVHLHNSHVRRTMTTLPWYAFWPTGAHLDQLFGARFAVIGGAVGISEPNFIGAPEADTIEARLLARQADCFLPVRRARELPRGELAALPTRTGPTRPFVAYEPVSSLSLADLDGIAFFRTATHTRGMPPWPGQ